MSTRMVKKGEAAAVREKCVRAVEALAAQVEEWARREGWQIRRSEKEITEREIGTYRVPILEIGTPEGEVALDPAGSDVLGSEGRVDLYAWPTLYRVRLLLKSGRWIVRTDSGLDWPEPWGEKTFASLASGLLGAE